MPYSGLFWSLRKRINVQVQRPKAQVRDPVGKRNTLAKPQLELKEYE